MPNLVVTASQSIHGRSLNIVNPVDGNKLANNIYDTIKSKETVSQFMIPKHSLSNFSMLNRNIESTSQISHVSGHLGIVTPSSTPGSSRIDKFKYTKDDGTPKVTVKANSAPLAVVTPTNFANERILIPPKVSNDDN